MYEVYILEYDNGEFYVGYTNNLPARLVEHAIKQGKLFTLRHSIPVETKDAALSLEMRLQKTLMSGFKVGGDASVRTENLRRLSAQ